jgi:hypothetical protein
MPDRRFRGKRTWSGHRRMSESAAREALEADLYALLDKFNVAEEGTLVILSAYLEVVITKRS